MLLLDVRTDDEFNEKHLDGAVNISVQMLTKTVPDVPKDERIEVYCVSGGRATMAKLILGHKGFTNVHLYNGTGAMN
jgi:phage shock protein E